MQTDIAWRPWGAMLGCRCIECESEARRFACLQVDAELRLVTSGFVSDDGSRFGAVAQHGSQLREIIGDEAFALMQPHLQAALEGRGWSGAFAFSEHDAPPIIVKIGALPMFDAQGSIGVQITLEDKSRAYAQREMQTALREKLAIIHRSAADAILTIDQNGRVESVNRAGEILFGWNEGELIGRPISVLMPPPIAAAHQGYIERYLKTGVSGILNVGPRPLLAQRKDGACVWVELSVAEAQVGAGIVFIGVCRDLGVKRPRSVAGHAERAADTTPIPLHSPRAISR